MTGPASRRLPLFLLVLALVSAAGCELAGGIFKAGFWIGVVLAVIVVVGLIMLFRRA